MRILETHNIKAVRWRMLLLLVTAVSSCDNNHRLAMDLEPGIIGHTESDSTATSNQLAVTERRNTPIDNNSQSSNPTEVLNDVTITREREGGGSCEPCT